TVPPPAPAEPDHAAALAGAIDALLAAHTPELFQSVEETLVRTAFARSGDNQVRAARALGITRNTLRTLLKRHGLLAESAAAARDDDDDHRVSLAH
ncbi:helix-turn-helix domain-containing protein, partial [Salmonella enterica]|uniref:helix-turn-helix domain-containing protein n=1 Tax=Salmonella enterica TaxID=28901 RepID=UPI003FA6A64D